MRRCWTSALVALWAVVGLANVSLAADEGAVLRMRAEQLAADGNCEAAIDKARRARDLDATDASAAVIEGRCLLLLQRYGEAVEILGLARKLDPSVRGVSADLAAAHYHLDDKAQAQTELDRAAIESPNDPRVEFYKGLLLLERNRDAEAAGAFERASRMDAAIDPIASFYAGLAWERARDAKRARAALERLRSRAPNDPWANEAQLALDRLDRGGSIGAGRWWATATAGLEYDDNVVLRGDNVQLPSGISSQRDGRGFWSAELGVEVLRGENWAGGVIAGYHGNAHFEAHRFDLQYPTASLWLDRRVDEASFLRIQPFIGYAWTETDPYLFNVGGTVAYHRDYREAGAGRLYFQYAYRDYLFTAQTPAVPPADTTFATRAFRARDRDGDDYRAGYDHSVGVAEQTILRGGAAYGYYDAEGRDFTHQSIGGYAGVQQGLPLELTFDADVTYAFMPYEHASSFLTTVAPARSSPDREDHVVVVRAQLSRPITENLSVAGHWRYTENDSNTSVFDYDRHVVGGSVTLYFGP